MVEPHDTVSSQDDDVQDCKAELPHIIASVLGQRNETLVAARAAAEREALIARSIEAEVIPGLLMAHLERPLARVAAKLPPNRPIVIDDQHIAHFADLVVNEPVHRAVEHINGLVASGTSMDVIFSDLFARTARLLGDQWLNDESSFLNVTLGLANLQQLLRRFSPDFGNEQQHEPNGNHLLLAAMPGESHTFGMTVVEEYFRRDGWMVTLELPPQAQSLLNVLRESWFDMVGLSIGDAGATEELAQLIRDIRRSSRNHGVRIIIGGCALPLATEAFTRTGADLFAMTAEEAVQAARQFMAAQCR